MPKTIKPIQATHQTPEKLVNQAAVEHNKPNKPNKPISIYILFL